jgi:hypothetical protein
MRHGVVVVLYLDVVVDVDLGILPLSIALLCEIIEPTVWQEHVGRGSASGRGETARCDGAVA